jgi:hypothetical protein
MGQHALLNDITSNLGVPELNVHGHVEGTHEECADQRRQQHLEQREPVPAALRSLLGASWHG